MYSSSNTIGGSNREPLGHAERDVVALGIAVAALILFVGTGGTVLPQIVSTWLGHAQNPDVILSNALLLNIALIIFGWRRYAQLSREVAERRSAEEKAHQLAQTDALTGLLNRRCFIPAAAKLVADVAETNQGAAVLMIDLDNFKQINDVHGHKAGDIALTEVARRMEALLPVTGIVARLGGDEFACVVPYERRLPDKLDQLAASLIEAVRAPIRIENKEVEAALSIGIARTIENPDPAAAEDCAQSLLHHADIAMYHAKKRGHNGYAWFEPTMESELRFRHELETGIRAGIPKGEFVPFYEQQIDLVTGDLVGFEMLARWNSPQFGLVSPEIFIPISEEIGVIAELSEHLIQQALQDAQKWDPNLTLSINISPLQLRDPWFSQKLLRLLVESGFPPHRLDIEITESCLHENIGVVRSVVTSLKNQGVQISLDDFGTGYSSLAQLRSLPFDRLKIDRSFVTELAHEGANAKIVEAIVSLGRGFDLPMTAEGIENAEVLKVLRTMGQLKGQGYLYGRPEDASKTFARLKEKRLLAPEVQEAADRADALAVQINTISEKEHHAMG
ncbi:putative bifunctional diguanylate cyclase/phosphodiesterase [Altererythrobacter sp. CC-YST694]|uniref:putative bifunctional diguanylate cyclase/phosphodiesterase n=1 Tax=Altererythrobacter sp. CC-YST694 TaxID=2755038 RepID=UPI001D015E02|nr:EAL domain-containing protein [Altererythrobacter sp. CC-YST694]